MPHSIVSIINLKIINSQKQIQYEIINVNSVQHPSEIYNTLICPAVFFNEKSCLFNEKSEHVIKLNWRRQ